LHREEVLAPKLAQQKAARADRLSAGSDQAKAAPPALATSKHVTSTPDMTALEIAVAKSSGIVSDVAQRPPALPHDGYEVVPDAVPPTIVTRIPQPPPVPERVLNHGNEPSKKYLFASDDLEAAPSIGPKTAERFAEVGVHTVGDFLDSDPHELADQLDDPHFDAETLTDWQDQAQMVIDVPGLRGTHAQLLVGAGYRTAEAVAQADAVILSANVLKFAATSSGKRVLREGRPPDIEKIKGWVDAAKHAVAA
jgi:hypothetical protein